MERCSTPPPNACKKQKRKKVHILPFYGGLQNNRNQPVIVENGLAGKGFRFSRRLKYFVKVDV